MKTLTLKGIGVLLAVVLTIAVAGCGESDVTVTTGTMTPGETSVTVGSGTETPEETAPATSPAEPAAAMPETTGPESAAPASGDAMSAAPAADAAAAAPAAGAGLTAETLAGTKWNAGGMAFTFEKDGVLKVNDTVPGTWSIDGTTLKVGAMGQEFTASIEGDKIIYDGTPLEKVN